MAKKITELTELTTYATNDLLIIEDVSTSTTKKITWANLVADSSITTAKLNDAAVTPAKLLAGTGSSWAWQTWAPTWTNVTIGNSTVVAKYTQVGKKVTCFVKVVFGTTGSSSIGVLSLSLPVTAATGYDTSSYSWIGGCQILNVGDAEYNALFKMGPSLTTAQIICQLVNASYSTASAVPVALGNTDILSGTFTYEAA